MALPLLRDRVRFAVPALIGAALIGWAVLTARGASRPPDRSLLRAATAGVESPALCPWREPKRDLAMLFPDAPAPAETTPEMLVLSPLRLAILKRLGPQGRIESNSLAVYRIRRRSGPPGAILVRRAAGAFGAIEVVVAVDADRRIVGTRIQRHREPDEAARFLNGDLWRSAFRGKTARDAFRCGIDLPRPPDADTRLSAEAVARAVRGVLIEFDVAEAARRSATCRGAPAP